MPRSVPFSLVLALLVSPPLAAQSTKATLGTVISDIRGDWLSGGVQSPNGRFYLLDSYASNDSGFLRYDRAKRSWAYLGRDIIGANPRWSPNGRFVAVFRQSEEQANQRHAWVIPMDTATGLASGPPRRVTTRQGIGPVTWSPDGRSIAFVSRASGQSSIVAVPFNGGDEQILFEMRGNLTNPVWSPDGQFIYALHNQPNSAVNTLRISLNDKRSTELGTAIAPIIDISPDGKWLAQYYFARPVVHLQSTDGKELRKVDLPPTSARMTPVGWSRTNPNEMVALDHIVPAGIQRVTIADGRIRTIVAFDSMGVDDVDLSPDERQLAYVRLRGGVYQLVVADTSGGNVRVIVDEVRSGAGWSPNGQHIAYSLNESDIRVVEVASKKTRELRPAGLQLCVRGSNCVGRLAGVRWRSDGRALRYFERRATSDGHTLEQHEIDLDGVHRVLGTTSIAGNPSFIARNDTMFLVSQPNALHLVNTRTGAARVIYSGGVRLSAEVDAVDASGQWILIVANSDGSTIVQQPLILSLTTGEAKKYPYALGGEVSGGSFLPDGRNLLLTACVTCRDPNYVEKWDVILTPMNGDPPRILTGTQPTFKDFWPIAVTRDGRTVYFSGQQSYNTRLVTINLQKP